MVPSTHEICFTNTSEFNIPISLYIDIYLTVALILQRFMHMFQLKYMGNLIELSDRICA